MTPDPSEVFTDDAFNLVVKYTDGELRKVNIKSFLVASNEIKTNLQMDHNGTFRRRARFCLSL